MRLTSAVVAAKPTRAGNCKIRDGPMAPRAGVAPISRRWAGVTLLTSATTGGFGGSWSRFYEVLRCEGADSFPAVAGVAVFGLEVGGGRGGTGCCRSFRVFRFGRGRCFGFLRLWSGDGLVYGFVREFGAERFQAVEIFYGAAVETLGLGLIAEKDGPGWGVSGETAEAFGEAEIAILGAGDFEVVSEDFGEELVNGEVFGVHDLIEADSEEAVFEGGAAEQGLLGKGDALDGEEFLGVDGPIAGDGVSPEIGDDVDFFEADDGEVFGGEGVLARVLGRAGFADRKST